MLNSLVSDGTSVMSDAKTIMRNLAILAIFG